MADATRGAKWAAVTGWVGVARVARPSARTGAWDEAGRRRGGAGWCGMAQVAWPGIALALGLKQCGGACAVVRRRAPSWRGREQVGRPGEHAARYPTACTCTGPTCSISLCCLASSGTRLHAKCIQFLCCMYQHRKERWIVINKGFQAAACEPVNLLVCALQAASKAAEPEAQEEPKPKAGTGFFGFGTGKVGNGTYRYAGTTALPYQVQDI